MLNKTNSIILTFTSIILGIIISIQIHSVFSVNKGKPSPSDEIKVLKESINKERELGSKLNKQIEDAEKATEAYFNYQDISRKNDNQKKLIEYRDELKVQIGLTTVKGPGIVMELNDAPDYTSGDAMDVIIHDFDIVRILNELKKAGAQAISVNDERIIWTSEQICAGPTIRVNKNRYSVPFTIKSIGDPDKIYNNITSSFIISQLYSAKIRIKINKSNEIIIPKYNYSINKLITSLEVVKDENK